MVRTLLIFLSILAFAYARELSVIRLEEEEPATTEGFVVANKEGFFSVDGCECICDCIGGSKDCLCSCTCEDDANLKQAERYATRNAEKAREERREFFRRELVASVTPAATASPTMVPSTTPSTAPSTGCTKTQTASQGGGFLFIGNQRSPLAGGGIFGRLRQRLTGRGAVLDEGEEDECDDESDVVRDRERTLLESFRGMIGHISESPELQDTKDQHFDFVMAGFPRSGTSTMSEALSNHKETSIAAKDECFVASASLSESAVNEKLNRSASSLTDVKGFKCPNAIFDYRTISRIESHSPEAKFIIGVRHPVRMIESFYNGLVADIYEGMLDEEIPSFEEVMSSDLPWKNLSIDASRYELFLMQFAKTSLTPAEMGALVGHEGYDIAIRPNNFELFLYSSEQLEDQDSRRSSSFRSDLQDYLRLSAPFNAFGHENVNRFVGSNGYAETMNICDRQFDDLRMELVVQGKKTANWITDKFMQSNDVKVSNKKHFIQTLKSWGEDPCVSVSA